jgi:putative DNA-invertase from lambdoid prophage Rac
LCERQAAGFAIEEEKRKQRIVTERSGSVSASKRACFLKLLDRLESGDVLTVTKLNQLGRNAKAVHAIASHIALPGGARE